jgi:NTP pyrophosphatase (non-canonical NTP hydrolase)
MKKKMPLSLNDYQDLSKRTLPEGKHSEVLTNMALGLVCEAGETGDHIKKHVFHGHDLDDDKVMKELGDTLFYLAGVASLLGYTLEEIGTMNIDKLMKRFPNGFNQEDSKKRVDL